MEAWRSRGLPIDPNRERQDGDGPEGFLRRWRKCDLYVSWANLAHGQTAPPSVPDKAARTKCEGTETPGTDVPAPADPHPLDAAGWEPEAGNGLFFSRWVENWTGMRTAGTAPPLKAMPLGGETSLTAAFDMQARHRSHRVM